MRAGRQSARNPASFSENTRRPKRRRPGGRDLGRIALLTLGSALVISALFATLSQLRGPAEPGGGAAAAEVSRDKALTLTVPKMDRVRDVPVSDAAADDEVALRGGALHVEDTGFPWEEANVYIAGHRLGYPRTRSFLVFWDLNTLRRGDSVLLEDSKGTRYVYRVFDRMVVPPDRVSVKKPIPGKNIVSLQTCTLPDYSERLVVRAELAETKEKA
ncbi:class E sortase [Rubrobacter tropicus]|uniref:class E sortase n=1 Tax=Rubrobacter tropicus TaxID=2653851 RepID=UPI001D18A628|nr:class E sortase [Rubrobacter tropicus]